MQKFILLLILAVGSFGKSVAKDKRINLTQSKVAVEVNIKDIYQQVKMGVTIFGDYKGKESTTNYKMPQYVTKHIEQIFGKLGIDYEFVNRQPLTDAELDGHKRRAQRKIREQHHKDFKASLQEQEFTDLLIFNFVSQKVRDNRIGLPSINGYGLYKIPGAICAYQTLGYYHVSLNGKHKDSRHNVVKEIPEKKKIDHVCAYGENIKSLGVNWKKDASNYSDTDRQLIENAIKNLVLSAMLDTFQRHGIIDSQLMANKLYIDFIQADFIVVEKVDSDQFEVNNELFNQAELVTYFENLVNDGKKVKVLAGLTSKSKYTFGDIKRVFNPTLKDTNVTVYRLGPQYEIIEI